MMLKELEIAIDTIKTHIDTHQEHAAQVRKILDSKNALLVKEELGEEKYHYLGKNYYRDYRGVSAFAFIRAKGLRVPNGTAVDELRYEEDALKNAKEVIAEFEERESHFPELLAILDGLTSTKASTDGKGSVTLLYAELDRLETTGELEYIYNRSRRESDATAKRIDRLNVVLTYLNC